MVVRKVGDYSGNIMRINDYLSKRSVRSIYRGHGPTADRPLFIAIPPLLFSWHSDSVIMQPTYSWKTIWIEYDPATSN